MVRRLKEGREGERGADSKKIHRQHVHKEKYRQTYRQTKKETREKRERQSGIDEQVRVARL